MNKLIIPFVALALTFTACHDSSSHEGHDHDSHEGHDHSATATGYSAIEAEAILVYSNKLELVAELKPLVVGKTAGLLAHFTTLGETFSPLLNGKIKVSLQNATVAYGQYDPEQLGIYKIAITPNKAGIFNLVIDVESDLVKDQLIIENVEVFKDIESIEHNHEHAENADEIAFTKEQSWKIDFATETISKKAFTEVIKTTGQIQSAQGDEVVITAKTNGVISFGDNAIQIGTAVQKSATLFTISGKGLTEDNIETKYKQAKTLLDKTKIDLERADALVENKIISEKEHQEVKLKYDNAKIDFNEISNNYSSQGHKVTSPLQGFVKNLLVSQGQYVEIGEPIATISQNRRLMLTAEVPQKHFSKLNSISSANFKTAYDNIIYSTDSLNGKLISYGRNADNNTYFIPVNFEIDNQGNLLSGSFVEIFLKLNQTQNALTIPLSALTESQGVYYVYVQTSGEGFLKKEVLLGANDGINVVVKSGIAENERIVSKGAYQIKLASISGQMPVHSHEH